MTGQTIQRLRFGVGLGPVQGLELKAVDHCRVYLDEIEHGAIYQIKSGGHTSYEYRGSALGAYAIEWLSCATSEELERRLRESVRVSSQKIRAWRARKGRETGLAFARAHITAKAIRDHEQPADQQRDTRIRRNGGQAVASGQRPPVVRKGEHL